MQRQTLRASAQAALRGSYFLFFFAAFFLADFLAAFFFLATVHPPLKVRQPATDRCNQCSGAERHIYKVDQAPTAERPRASGRQHRATPSRMSVTRDRLINSFLK
jgi:hypothetical protein